MADSADDILAGILSDGSEDSFFEKPKKVVRKLSASKVEKPAISNANEEKKVQKDDWLGGKVTDDERVLKPLEKTSVEKTTDKTVDKMVANKKSALIESLFGLPNPQKESESTTAFDDLLKGNKAARGTILPPEKSIEPPKDAVNLLELSRERRSRHSGPRPAVLDPLGLFSTQEKPTETTKSRELSATKVRDEDTHVELQPAPILPVEVPVFQSKSAPNVHKSLPTRPIHHETVADNSNLASSENARTDREPPQPLDHFQLESLVMQQKLAKNQIEFENSAVALQQQENQLLMAVQLKRYEENLMEMQRKQHEVLTKQEQKFNGLLEGQFARQQLMENNMRMQQERINSHIQMLIAQPCVGGVVERKDEKLEALRNVNLEENTQLYEDIIKTLKERQHEEKFILEESYKKQITLLEQSMASLENQLKEDLSHMSQQYQTSLEQLRADNSNDVKQYQEKIMEMTNAHTHEIKLMRENNNRIVEEIKYEYSTLIENFKQAKSLENSVMQSASEFSHKLENNLQFLASNSLTLKEIRGKVEEKFSAFEAAKEESLKVKEEEIKQMRLTLEKSREAADLERSQLIGCVQSLEMKLMELRQSESESRWAFQQATAILTARSSAFDREVEFTRSSLERERQQLNTLKESLLAEQEKMTLQLTEDKLALIAEKARFETTEKLNHNFETQKAKAETDAALSVARESAAQTDHERELLQMQQIEVETLKANLLSREKKLAARERHTQQLVREAESKQREGEAALAESRTLEDGYREKLREIQSQLVTLTRREKKLTEEKILVSKERLSLHQTLRQRCSLCAPANVKHEDNNYRSNVVESDFYPTLHIPDADIQRLRQEIIEDDDKCSEFS